MSLGACLGIGGTALVFCFALVQCVRMVSSWMQDDAEGER